MSALLLLGGKASTVSVAEGTRARPRVLRGPSEGICRAGFLREGRWFCLRRRAADL
jgi:hypothetical protein